MSKQAKYNTALDKQVEAWLESKGIKPSEVAADYTIKREDGLTRLTLTFFAADFPLPPAEPMSCTYHIDCALGRPHPDHTDNSVSRETNRPHPTCIDTTRADERPYSSWVCGPDCPTKNPKGCTCDPGDHLPYRLRCPANVVNPVSHETECPNGCAPGQHHFTSCIAK